MKLKFGSAFAWWFLSRKQKQVLQEQREAGKFGGQNAAGVGRAPYFWSQEEGNEAASIKPHHHVENAWDRYRARARAIIDAYFGD